MNNQEIIENLQRQVAEKRRLQLLEQEEQEHIKRLRAELASDNLASSFGDDSSSLSSIIASQ